MDWLSSLRSDDAPRRRPRVGISGPDRGGGFAWAATSLAVLLAGGNPIRLSPSRRPPRLPLDALIVGGGADVDPTLYGETLFEAIKKESKRSPFWLSWAQHLLSLTLFVLRTLLSVKGGKGLDPGRDKLEIALLRDAAERGLPVLGICRGSQILNVFYGGSLNQNLEDFYVETPQIRSFLPRKVVSIKPGSTLESILGRDRCLVNSLHKQAVSRLGKGLVCSAHELNGVVQAIEHTELPFVIGVQWHPEYLQLRREEREVFRRLVSAARTRLALGARFARPIANESEMARELMKGQTSWRATSTTSRAHQPS